MVGKILVPTDGSQLSQKAVASAVEVAAAFGAELVALHVVPSYPLAYYEGAASLSPDDVGRIERHWAEQGLAIVEAVCRIAEDAGVRAHAVTVRSDLVAEAILQAARKHGCDLIVMASHGRRGLQRVLLGSETQHVLTHGDVPVLVLR